MLLLWEEFIPSTLFNGYIYNNQRSDINSGCVRVVFCHSHSFYWSPTAAHKGPYHFMFRRVLFAPSALIPCFLILLIFISDLSVNTLLFCTYTLRLLSLRLIQGRFKVECFHADCTFILAAYLTHRKWRKWNMCLGGWCDGSDPTGCWFSRIAPCFVATVPSSSFSSDTSK